MTVDLKTLRKGDKVLIEATFTGKRVGDTTSVIMLSESQNEFILHRDKDVMEISQFQIAQGDRVKWFEEGKWAYGTVIGIDKDVPLDEQTYVWVREDGKWPRRTFTLTQLTRD